jgi:hypothetical protein
MDTTQELYRDNLRDTHWIGEVVENRDPLLNGRCRIRVFGKFDKLPVDAIPWATPMNRNLPGAHSVPNIGDIIAVRFDNGNLYHPEYWFEVNQSSALKKDVLQRSGEPHQVVSIVYDEGKNLKIFWEPSKGLVIETNGPILLGEEATQRLVLGDAFLQLFNSHTHIGNLGAPTSPPNPLTMNEGQHLSKLTRTE